MQRSRQRLGPLAHAGAGDDEMLALEEIESLCADGRHGRELDESLLRDLPPGVDPCGENGEFHTFTYAGPMFDAPLDIETGAVVVRDPFVFIDLCPIRAASSV